MPSRIKRCMTLSPLTFATVYDGDAINTALTSTSLPLVMATSWEDYAGGYEVGQVTKYGPIVVCQGLIKRSVGAAAFTSGLMATVPAGYRPGANNLFIAMSSPGPCRVDVTPTGTVVLSTTPAVSIAAGGWLSVQFAWTI